MILVFAVIVSQLGGFEVEGQLDPNNTLRCRSCHNAANLGDCNTLVNCDARTEMCYMEEMITDALRVVYNGGCRAIDICNGASNTGVHGLPVGKRSLISCARCCNTWDDCNKRFCGIKDDSVNASQCYYCNDKSLLNHQTAVRDPMECVTLEVCEPNQVCFAERRGDGLFQYGCERKLLCQLLMKRAYEDHRRCVLNDTSFLPFVSTWEETCGGYRPDSPCHACCAEGGCNYGTCLQLNASRVLCDVIILLFHTMLSYFAGT